MVMEELSRIEIQHKGEFIGLVRTLVANEGTGYSEVQCSGDLPNYELAAHLLLGVTQVVPKGELFEAVLPLISLAMSHLMKRAAEEGRLPADDDRELPF